MDIYVAAKFEEKGMVRQIFEMIEDAGHSVAYDWTTHEPIKPYSKNSQQAREYAENEIEAIKQCDVFICILNKKGTTLLIECGAAIAAGVESGVDVYVTGERRFSSPWLHLPQINKRESVEHILAEVC